MSEAIGFVLQLFGSFISIVFGYLNFEYNGYTGNIGWLLISALVFSMMIASILNLPSRFTSRNAIDGSSRRGSK